MPRDALHCRGIRSRVRPASDLGGFGEDDAIGMNALNRLNVRSATKTAVEWISAQLIVGRS